MFFFHSPPPFLHWISSFLTSSDIWLNQFSSFIIRLSFSAVLLSSTYIHTVTLLSQKRERRIPLLSPYILPITTSFLFFHLEQNPLKPLFILALYKLSFFIISWCHYIWTVTHHSMEAVIVKVTGTSLCETQCTCLNFYIICTNKEAFLVFPIHHITHSYNSQPFRTSSCQLLSLPLLYLVDDDLLQKDPEFDCFVCCVF